MKPIRKVSSFQAALATLIAGGAQTIALEQIGCVRGCWCELRAIAGLEVQTPLVCGVTEASRAWATAILEHLKRRRYKSRLDGSARALQRKITGAKRRGLIPTNPPPRQET